MADTVLKIIENTPTLQTDRLTLRKFTEGDTEDFFLIVKDPEVNTYLPWFPAKTSEQAYKMMWERYLDYYDEPSAYRYAICLKTDDRPIGYIAVSDDDSRDFGYGLRREFWHKGIVTEAGRAVVDRVRKAGLPYITATHDRKNPRSGQVMRNVGMTYRYSYREQWQPKDISVIFRMYQLNFDGSDFVYMKYWNQYPSHFIEEL